MGVNIKSAGWSGVLIGWAVLGGASVTPAATGITGLGLPAGATYSLPANPTGVSGDGKVVVGGTGSGTVSPFRWTQAGGMTLLSERSDAVSDIARGVNGDGSVVVGVDSTASVGTAFRWTAATGVVSLGSLSGSKEGSVAYAVNGAGDVVVGNSGGSTGPAFRWTESTGMVALAASSGEAISSYAYGVSRDGRYIVGQANNLTGSRGPFRWTESTGMVPLAGPVGFFSGEAKGVSADGGVIAGETLISGGGIPQATYAFRWTPATGMASLGELPGGTVYSAANAISDDGTVIVGNSDSSFGSDTFYWTPGGGMRRLWDVLLENGIDPAASGWTKFQSATGVSADGKTVVGYGVHDGGLEAYAVTIPEPAVGVLVGVAAVALGRRRRAVL